MTWLDNVRLKSLLDCHRQPDYLCQLVRLIRQVNWVRIWLKITVYLMLENVNKLQNIDACLLFLASNYPLNALTQVGMH